MSDRDPFFVGYLPVPPGLRMFFLAACLILIAGAAFLSFAIASTQDDPGDGRFRFDYGPQTVQGVLELTPSPILHVTQGTDAIPVGHTLMLSGQGKNGAVDRAAALEGQLVQATGILIERGDLDMMQLNGGNNFRAADDQSVIPDIPTPEPLGRWQITGEICDGKCEAGAMNPGRGIAHRACANLCLLGGVPPVFVTTQPVEGEDFLLIAGEGDDTLPPALLDYVGLYVTLEGEVARHGDILVFTVDTENVVLAQ
ncbi:hypothetical protein [Hasllibacter sp. MH4015]|uniref:hypothetical protein n=1 Tax=Hasllibacter sp. MH4015 TaxID=2854029 RepID=UPI001CD5BAC6|nr:hypothetical protein [Hasllibacter sp. MH4015]